jgi:flagellar biogenesis protein FliO
MTTGAKKHHKKKKTDASQVPDSNVGVQLSSLQAMGLLLLALLACIAAGVFLMRKLRQRKTARDVGRLMSLKETLWLGKGQRLLLVTVSGRDVLLSVTAQGIQTLVTFPGDGQIIPAPAGEAKSGEAIFPSMIEEEMAAPVDRQPAERGKVPSNERVKQILRRLNTL